MAYQSAFEFGSPSMFMAPMQAYFKGLETMTQSMGPMKGLARWQLEAAGLMSRRAQAYMEIPSRLSRCRTPQDLVAEQTRYWQTAFQQYAESSKRMMDAWAQATTPTGFGGFGSNAPARRERDYITFNDPKDANGLDREAQSRHAA